MSVPRNWVDDLLQTMDEALFLLDGSGTIVQANIAAQRLTARGEDDLHGRALAEVVRGADLAIERAALEGATRGADLAVTTPDGHRVPIEAGFTRLPGMGHEDEPMVLCIARDVSLTKQLQSELRVARGAALSATRQRTMLLATMSHEIRTPLNGVIGMAGLLLETPLSLEQRQMVETINNSGSALLDLVNDILDFTRVDAGQVELELVAFDLRATIDDMMDGLAPAAHAKGIELVTDLDPALPSSVLGDPGRLRQVLNNLLGNAIKFTDEGHTLLTVDLLRLDDLDATLRFEVQDTGIGISEQVREALFRPFVQADPSAARRHGGSGLGLTVARWIVRLMGGELDVASAPREGARFSFRLDLRRDTEGEPSPPVLALDGDRVLIVSPCGPRRSALARTLRAWGARPHWTIVEEALDILRQADAAGDPYGLVLLDGPPRGSVASDLATRIVDDGMRTTPTVFLMCAVGSIPSPATLGECGVALAITKPVRHDRLEMAVRLALRPARAMDYRAAESAGFPRLQGEGVRVLVAEDNVINQKVALGHLRAMGLQADAVGNGREAIEAVARGAYTVVLMDVHMPELDGLGATIRIRRAEAERRIPIIGLTADVRPEARERCHAAGMDAFLPKPVTPRKLAEALRPWIAAADDDDDSRVVGEHAKSLDAVLDLEALRRLRELESVGSQGDLVAGLVRMFVERTPLRIERMARAFSVGQHGFVELEAHSLKSSCRNLGADRMASCAAALERAAASASPSGDLVVRLGREFTTVATLLCRLTRS